ncbi:MAG: FAD-dependent oxidoreductase [Paracoccaceae bacterium]
MNIAIAGAGIAGLAAATFLARAGHRVRIYDQFPAPRPVGSGMMVQPVGLAVLERLGLAEALIARAAPVTRIMGRNDRGRVVLDVGYDALGTDAVGYGTQRALLFDLLLGAAVKAGVELIPETEVLGSDATEAGVQLRTEGGTLGTFDLLLDCLGVASPLCPQASAPLAYGALWALLDWPEGAAFAPDRLEQRYRQASRMVGVLPVGQLNADSPQKLTFFWSLKGTAHADWRARPMTLWKDEVRSLWPETDVVLDQIADHEDLFFAQYTHRTLRRPGAGRIAHLGDSFHATSPQLGQGANMALLDALALAVAVSGRGSVSEATERYAKLRRLHVRLYQTASWMFTPVYQSDSRVLPWIRDRVAAPASRLPLMPRLLARLVAGDLADPLGWIDG